MRYVLAMLTCAALSTSALTAQEPPKLPDNSAHMKRFAWVIGAWAGSGTMPGYGKHEFRSEFSWTLNRNFIKTSYWMTIGGKVIWHDTGLLGWDRQKKKLVTFTFGFDGTIGGGEQLPPKSVGLEKGTGVLVVESRTTGDPPFDHFRWVLRRVDDKTLEGINYSRKDGKWVVMQKTIAKRVKGKPAPKSQPAKKGK